MKRVIAIGAGTNRPAGGGEERASKAAGEGHAFRGQEGLFCVAERGARKDSGEGVVRPPLKSEGVQRR